MGNNVTCENFDIEFGEVQIVGGEGGSDGYDVGYEDGYAKGNADGYAKGNAEGQEKGKAEGKEEGKQIGFADAISKQTELSVSYNGIYTPQNGSVGFNKVTVSVQEKKPNLQDKTFTANGTYSADENYDGLGSVVVAVPKAEIKLQEKTVTANGEVVADSGFDGLSKVTVNVASGGSGSGSNKVAQVVSGTVTELTAEDMSGATAIDKYKFYMSYYIKSVHIPATVTQVGMYAFYNCSALSSVVIEDGASQFSVQTNAFAGCSKIPSIVLPSKTINIAEKAFSHCTAMTTVTIKASNPPTLSSSGFNQCTVLAQIIVPTGCGDAYKSATNWSAYADKIVEEGAV